MLRRRQKQKLFSTVCSILINLYIKLFKSCFQILRKTFSFVLNRIGHYVNHDTTASEPISPKDRLEICIYGLRFYDYYQATVEMTGNGLATVHCIIQEVCTVIVSKL